MSGPRMRGGGGGAVTVEESVKDGGGDGSNDGALWVEGAEKALSTAVGGSLRRGGGAVDGAGAGSGAAGGALSDFLTACALTFSVPPPNACPEDGGGWVGGWAGGTCGALAGLGGGGAVAG
ncbi:MAG: hypothetical protein FJX76_10005 [Armatimonadetes bacterium]|nr:hypothetical protein [Armatimonadota bacterium]